MMKLGLVLAVCSLGVAGAFSIRAAAQPAQTQPASTAPAQNLNPEAAHAKDVLKLLARALDDGDRARILELLWADTDEQRNWVSATADLAQASAELRRAAVAGFGAQASQPLGVDTAATPQAIQRIERAQVSIDGDRAVVQSTEEGSAPLRLIRRPQGWRLPVAEFCRDADPEEMQRAIDALSAEARLFRELAGEISAGKYTNGVDARQALDRRLVKFAMPQLEPSTNRTPTTHRADRP